MDKIQTKYKKITQLFHNSLSSSSLKMRVIITFFKNLDRTKIYVIKDIIAHSQHQNIKR